MDLNAEKSGKGRICRRNGRLNFVAINRKHQRGVRVSEASEFDLMDEENGKAKEAIVDFNSAAVDLSGKVHQLPCAIKLDGPCSVSHHFKPKSTGVEVDGLGVEEAYFRGRKLQGATISLPEGYSGYVIGRKSLGKRKACDESEDSSPWQVKAKFENITYWNHGALPSQDDTFRRSFHWLTVAQALHQPVTAEDLVSASAALKNMS